MNSQDRRVRIRQEEIDSLLNLKSQIDDKELLASYAEEYQKLAWLPVALDAQDGTDLKVDFGARPEIWRDSLWRPDYTGTKINLGVRTGERSRLMVLEVITGQGEAILDQYGEWRAVCVAALGTTREQHFYAWPQSSGFDWSSSGVTPECKWFGEGQVVLAPPSFEAEMGETWRWLRPPWEKPPQYPSPALGRFLQGHVPREFPNRPGVSLSWQEIYCLASPHEPLLQALSASLPLMEDYYQGIIQAAMAVGLQDPEVLFPLLWHAPHGDARRVPERGAYLQKLVRDAQARSEAATSPGNMPPAGLLNNAWHYDPEYSANGPMEPLAVPGPPNLLKRWVNGAPQSRWVPRIPLSRRQTGRYSREA